MLTSVSFLAIGLQLPNLINTLAPCRPNTQFVLNGFLCYCNQYGTWNEASCVMIGRRTACLPGEIVRRGCSQCICLNNNLFTCDNKYCVDTVSKIPDLQKLSQYGPRCTPFRSYYVNCSLCVCPASGQTSDAQCAVDISCPLIIHSLDSLRSNKQHHCFPNVMYLFPCLQCLCTETGVFSTDRCVEKCKKPPLKVARKCIPGALYRTGCSICKCPENSVPDERLCEIARCQNGTSRPYLESIHGTKSLCTPHVFTEPRCLFCDCKPEGIINENSCIELDCAKASRFRHDTSRESCSPGEIVSICVECFCLRHGGKNQKYCTRSCSNQNKLEVLENVLKENKFNSHLVDEDKIIRVKGDKCIPKSLYIDEGRYCLCPENANTDFKFCTSFYKYIEPPPPRKLIIENNIDIDFDTHCKPSTLVEFGCNICFCSSNGRIDPKWCTYDDCVSKKIIQESHKAHPTLTETKDLSETCTPGSISTVKCNFCICPDSGRLMERVCTKNECLDTELNIYYDKFTCEPLAYYEVDCNICFCPSDGLKNVAKCTKNSCETSFLRSSDYCVPSHLFSDGCNVCVCPLNGNKRDKACTSHSCGSAPWDRFRLTRPMMDEDLQVKRSIDVCFRGEEFVEGCKICVCSDMELKAYATCEDVLCNDISKVNHTAKEHWRYTTQVATDDAEGRRKSKFDPYQEDCFIYNASQVSDRQECTPGSMYIVRCKQCICPYSGNINQYCRPLPKSVHCEQAYPGINYLPMGRRDSLSTTESSVHYKQKNKNVQHRHTKYSCETIGLIMDKCFICECEKHWLIEEHCFQSDAQACDNTTPTFIANNKLIKFCCLF